MSKRLLAGTAIVGGLATLAAFAVPVGAATTNATATGPSTSTAPYVLPTASGVDITSLLTVSDSGAATNGYEMVGIPDGLGARFTAGRAEVFMNHELPADRGVVRAHGKKGAFVSKLTVNPATNEVVAGADLIQPGVRFYDYLTDTYASAPNAAGTNQTTGEAFPAYPAAFGRFCSASLTDPFQLFNLRTGRGDLGQIYFGNEESGNEGRTFGITTGGQAQQLPRLGLFSWENTLVARNQSDTTVAIGMEDSADGQLHVYRGTKQRAGTIFDKAGFTNGSHAVVRVGVGPSPTPGCEP